MWKDGRVGMSEREGEERMKRLKEEMWKEK
jgi:hypothetical protein